MKMDVLMTRMRKTSSASLIAREQVAVAVGSPCGVYQYLVGALLFRSGSCKEKAGKINVLEYINIEETKLG